MQVIKLFILTFIFAVLYIPIIILGLYSFNDGIYTSEWLGFTTRWYQILLHDSELIRVTVHSLAIATLSATISAIVGALTAVLLYRYSFFGKKFLYCLLFILIILPDIVIGISMLLLFHFGHISLGFWTLLLAHVTICIPFVTMTILGRIHRLDRHVFEAAKDLGASDFVVFQKIFFPLLFPAILSGWLLSFTLSFDDVIVSFFVTGPSYQILPLYLYSLVRLGVKPEINALCTLIFLVTLVLVLAYSFISQRSRS